MYKLLRFHPKLWASLGAFAVTRNR
uniref:Uncharacterized protein n=1 Tax=Anopheles minimus TaxID=112268 RepID=A0A182WN08_9DIPT